MADPILFVWCSMDPFLYGRGDSSKLTWFFCGTKKEEGLEGRSSLHFLDNLEGEESRGV